MSGIVVGIDGSHNASRALEWAMSEAAIRKTQLTVITVLPEPASHWTGRPVPFPSDAERIAEIRKSAEAAVEATAAKLGGGKPESVAVTAVAGFTVETLISASKDSDMLVVGTRGGAGFAPLILGSVTNQVVHQASCPVVVVPAGK
jgi:nucleotide-binding universal stress UspA family protein